MLFISTLVINVASSLLYNLSLMAFGIQKEKCVCVLLHDKLIEKQTLSNNFIPQTLHKPLESFSAALATDGTSPLNSEKHRTTVTTGEKERERMRVVCVRVCVLCACVRACVRVLEKLIAVIHDNSSQSIAIAAAAVPTTVVAWSTMVKETFDSSGLSAEGM